DVHLIAVADDLKPMTSTEVFEDNDHLVTAMTATPDGRYVLIADGSSWLAPELDHRIGVIEVLTCTLLTPQVLMPLPYDSPTTLVASPYNNAVLLLTAEAGDDGITYFAYDLSNSTTPFTYAGEVAYTHGRPQLPAGAVVIERGGLTGRVLVSENVGVRQVQFLEGGTVVDVDLHSTGSGYQAIVGAIGVQP
ncbi:hypothetical protein ACFL6C_09740, partial [Myxococcota bacterium]